MISAWAIPGRIKRDITASEIIDIVCEETGVLKPVLFSRLRSQKVSDARYLAMYFIRKEIGMTYMGLGSLFNRHHTDIMHAMNRIEGFIDSYDPLAETIRRISSVIDQRR